MLKLRFWLRVIRLASDPHSGAAQDTRRKDQFITCPFALPQQWDCPQTTAPFRARRGDQSPGNDHICDPSAKLAHQFQQSPNLCFYTTLLKATLAWLKASPVVLSHRSQAAPIATPSEGFHVSPGGDELSVSKHRIFPKPPGRGSASTVMLVGRWFATGGRMKMFPMCGGELTPLPHQPSPCIPSWDSSSSSSPHTSVNQDMMAKQFQQSSVGEEPATYIPVLWGVLQVAALALASALTSSSLPSHALMAISSWQVALTGDRGWSVWQDPLNWGYWEEEILLLFEKLFLGARTICRCSWQPLRIRNFRNQQLLTDVNDSISLWI